MWLYASRGHRLIDEHVGEARVRSRTVRYLPGRRSSPGAPLFAAGIGLAFINTWAAIAWWGALAVFFLLPQPE